MPTLLYTAQVTIVVPMPTLLYTTQVTIVVPMPTLLYTTQVTIVDCSHAYLIVYYTSHYC